MGGTAHRKVLYACQTADGQLVYFRVRKLRQDQHAVATFCRAGRLCCEGDQ